MIRNGAVAVHLTSEEMARISRGAAPFVAALEARAAETYIGDAVKIKNLDLQIACGDPSSTGDSGTVMM
jgi:hypothetical protein